MNKNRIKKFINKIRKLDLISKISIIIIVAIMCYIILLFILKPIIINPNNPPTHSIIMEDHLMTYKNYDRIYLNIFSIIGASVIATIIALIIKNKKTNKKINISKDKLNSINEELNIIKKALSSDERKALEIIEKENEITQDSLTFRLEWSRAKSSTILSHLERMSIIQRKREGKTYIVFIPKK